MPEEIRMNEMTPEDVDEDLPPYFHDPADLPEPEPPEEHLEPDDDEPDDEGGDD